MPSSHGVDVLLLGIGANTPGSGQANQRGGRRLFGGMVYRPGTSWTRQCSVSSTLRRGALPGRPSSLYVLRPLGSDAGQPSLRLEDVGDM